MSARFEIVSYNVKQTETIGSCLGSLLEAGDIICLEGNLGAGKTALTRGIAAGWGAREPVTSPTFTLVHEHQRDADTQTLFHIDCYRLHSAADAWHIGLDDLFYGEGPVVIEWPRHIEDIIPAERLWITFTIEDGTQRHLTINAAGQRYNTLLHDLQQTALDRRHNTQK
ncbi:MAG: tRNA (adenosine(37)-N6)-threonylcarbamoyltransferase complex ATPase subunit type 1 TsaE [Anaerolineae bacterium]|nr:tRNA (adenosine(37)-N6)-threonylcarbamoyltransferase complex ATPase subunit type 1 TsaE [Anaerolineae bacterium]